MAEFLADLATVSDDFGTIRTTSFVVPLAAEYVFRTVGHHFLTSDSAMFVNKYDQVFHASLVPEVTRFLPAHILYHAALHCISPGRVLQVVRAQSETMNIPDAIKTRMNSAPSGTAIITTTAAIIDAVQASGQGAEYLSTINVDFKLISDMNKLVGLNPAKYHKSYFAYGVAKPTQAEIDDLERARSEAIRFAPIGQAFLDTYLSETDLNKAQALKKHAQANPMIMTSATNLFKRKKKEVPTGDDAFEIMIQASSLKKDKKVENNEDIHESNLAPSAVPTALDTAANVGE
ncbi:hypothetical protein G6F57_016097 [Rhizopus arrhizus]|nr:hypothetical protein G6F30_012919 [Rhizopus arrhizus]KAG0973355.1 hypothetical protein G6F29_012890 [Rhizopus arrhizus]KAG0975651.1 hypothetical protein G6F28_012864 [Rhizopus arrhizus]KAG1001346.1 hypothetical protein G6F27_012958 [Rhizopus arrhizus]KAG1015752.1 hypothetical protein G6F26_013045 [Rhizopus arrhizus]